MSKLLAIETKSGSTYYYDTEKKKLMGGKIIGTVQVVKASFLEGARGKAILTTGETLVTSPIIRIF